MQGLSCIRLSGGMEVVTENEQEIEVRAGAGEVWDDFVAYTVKNSWYGAEICH